MSATTDGVTVQDNLENSQRVLESGETLLMDYKFNSTEQPRKIPVKEPSLAVTDFAPVGESSSAK